MLKRNTNSCVKFSTPSTQGGVRYRIKVCAHDDEIEWKCYQKIRATTRRDVIARVCCNKRTGRKSVCYYPYTVATVELRTNSPSYSSKWEVSGRGKVPVSHKELQKKTKNLGGKLKFYYLEFLYPSFLTTRIPKDTNSVWFSWTFWGGSPWSVSRASLKMCLHC